MSLREHAGRQPERHALTSSIGLARGDWNGITDSTGREDLFAHHLHVRSRPDREWSVRTARRSCGRRGRRARPVTHGLGHPLLGAPRLGFADHRPDHGGGITRVADLHLARAASTSSGVKRSSDRVLDEQPLQRGAHLAGAAEPGVDASRRRPLQIGVVADDGRRNAAQLQGDRAEADGTLQQPSHRRAAGEGEEADVLVLDEPAADLGARPLHQRGVSRRQPGLEQQLEQQRRR